MPRLTVLTWNLWGRPPARVGLPEVLARFAPDLLFLQETDGAALRLAPALAPWMAHAYADARAGTSPGMTIASTLPLRDAATLPADGPWDKPRVLHARLSVGGRELLAVCVHAKAPLPIPFLHAGPRNRQLAELDAWLSEQASASTPAVVAGDFNTVGSGLPGLVDTAVTLGRPRPTWRPLGMPRLPGLFRLDRVFVSPGISPLSATVACSLSTSDHCPVIVTLDVPRSWARQPFGGLHVRPGGPNEE